MELKLNSLTRFNNIVCFSENPNILSITNDENGTKAGLEISFGNTAGIDLNTEYTLIINGQVLKSTTDEAKCVGNRFLLLTNNTIQARRQMAFYLTRAIRNLNSISSTYTVYQSVGVNGDYSTNVIIEANGIGKQYNLEVSGDMTDYLNITNTKGTDDSVLNGDINIEVLQIEPEQRLGTTTNVDGVYKTTLSKKYISGHTTYFDLTPLFSIFAEEGTLKQLKLNIYNDAFLLGQFDKIYVCYGYMSDANQPFIDNINTIIPAFNTDDDHINYIYDTNIELSVFSPLSQINILITYKDSAGDISGTETFVHTNASNLTDININLNTIIFNNSYTVEININNQVYTYKIIKPIAMANPEDYERVYWRNCYGGVSFFDFTANRAVNRSTNTETYKSQIFHYYDGQVNNEHIYEKTVTEQVSLLSHNIEYEAVKPLLEAQKSRYVWVYKNGIKNYVNLTNLTVNETNSKDIYQAQITYQYL